MKKKLKWICLFFCIAASLFFVLPVQGKSEEIHTHGMAIRTEQEFLQMQNGGEYYLENDLIVSEPLTVSGELNFCLNGKVLQYQNSKKTGSLFRITENGILNIHDCSEEIHTYEVKANGLWVLSENTDEEVSKDIKTTVGGVIIGGTGENREIEELEASYLCGGFAYAEAGIVRIYGGNIVGNTADFGGAVYLSENASLEIYGGKFCGNLSAYRGGAVFSQSGSVLMNGGIISENRANKNGGGINISGNGTFTMYDGLISGNKALFWSGGVENFGTFEMFGGTVSGNTATEDGGGIYNGGTFTMRGGNICENIAKYGAGICNDKMFSLYGGNIFDNMAQESGGGIYNAHTAEMYGGKISGNVARTSGGGIENDGTFDFYDGMIGGTEAMEANTAYLGGGVCTYSGVFTMHGGRIEKNTAVDGGGVENEASFVMTGGIITQNFASMQGGGISNRGELILKGTAEVIGNGSGTNMEEDHRGGGVYWLAGETSTIILGGSVRIAENTTNGQSANLVISGKGKITVSALETNACVGLTLLDKNKTETAGMVLQWNDNSNAEAFVSCFSSDDSLYTITAKMSGIKLLEKNIDFAIGLFLGIFIVAIIVFVMVLIFVRRIKNTRQKSSKMKKRKKL